MRRLSKFIKLEPILFQVGLKPSDYIFVEKGDRLGIFNGGNEGALGKVTINPARKCDLRVSSERVHSNRQ